MGAQSTQQYGAGGGEVSTPSHSMLCSRYQLHSQEEAKERRHSHTIGGLPEADDQPELPSPPALPMALVGKGPLTSIGQCPPPPCASLGPSVPRCPGSVLGHPPVPEPWVDVLLFVWHPQLSASHAFGPTNVLSCGWEPMALHQGIQLILSALPTAPHSSGDANWSPAMFLLGPFCSWRVWGIQAEGLGLAAGDGVHPCCTWR